MKGGGVGRIKVCFCRPNNKEMGKASTTFTSGFDMKSGQWSLIFWLNARNRLAVGLAEGCLEMLVIHGSRTVVSWEQSWNLNLLTGNNDIVVEGSHLLPETLSGSLFQTMFTTDVSSPFSHQDPFLAHIKGSCSLPLLLSKQQKFWKFWLYPKEVCRGNILTMFASVVIKCQY